MYDYLIVGAGLYGSTFARLAAQKGKRCYVIDKRDKVAGNCADYLECGIHVHQYGAHIFHTNSEQVWKFVNKFAEFVPYVHNVKAISDGEIYSLPFNMNTFCELFGFHDPAMMYNIIHDQIAFENIENPKNLEEQAISLVGRTVYEKLIKYYTEKQWGTTCDKLSPDIIKRLPLRFTFDNNYFNDRFQALPKEGYTKFVMNMLNHDNIDLSLSTNFFDINDSESIAKKIVFTGPIDAFFEYRLGELDWRSLTFVHHTFNYDNYQGAPVINICDNSSNATRFIEHKHFLHEKSPSTIVTWEFPKKYEPGDEQYYPINDEKNQKLYESYHRLAKHYPHVIFGGRLGTYKYFDMDDVIEQAMMDFAREN